MNKRTIVTIFAAVGLAAAIILTACKSSPVYQATNFPTFQPSTTHIITLDIRTYDAATVVDLPTFAVFELPTGRAHFLGPHFTVQVLAEQETRFTIHAPGYAPIDKTVVPHYQRDAHLSMEVPLTPAGLPAADAQILAMMREAVTGPPRIRRNQLRLCPAPARPRRPRGRRGRCFCRCRSRLPHLPHAAHRPVELADDGLLCLRLHRPPPSAVRVFR